MFVMEQNLETSVISAPRVHAVWVVCRKLFVSGICVTVETESRILHLTVLHPVDADRGDILGRVLDQQELGPGQSVSRSDHRSDDDYYSSDFQRHQCVLPEGAGRLVCCVLGFRIWLSARVCLCQRLRSQRETQTGRRAASVDYSGIVQEQFIHTHVNGGM